MRSVWIVLAVVLGVFSLESTCRAGTMERVNVSSSGEQSNSNHDYAYWGPASISADGRFVVFNSPASNLVPGDTNAQYDAFVRDRQKRTTERASVSSAGEQGYSDVGYERWGIVVISADGRYVAFDTGASTLVPGDTNGVYDVFVRDRQTGTTERVSIGSSGEQSDSASDVSAISADGRYIAFRSYASNLVAGDTNGEADAFLRDRQTGTTERVSLSSTGEQANGRSFGCSMGPGGRYVTFWSDASNLVAGDTNGEADAFLRDRQAGTTERVSLSSTGEQANGASSWSSLSGDGRYVAFASAASNLVPGDTNGRYDVFVRDRQTGATERVSVSSSGEQGDDQSVHCNISADGRYVAFSSAASNLVLADTNAEPDIFIRDRLTATTVRVSVSVSAEQGNGGAWDSDISADGQSVVFYSMASNLVAGDTNGFCDVFVRDRGSVSDVNLTISATTSTTEATSLSQVGYGIECVNTGIQDLTGVTVSCALPSEVDCISVLGTAGSYDEGTRTVTWDVGDMAAGSQPVQLGLEVQIREETSPGTIIALSVAAAYDQLPDPVESNTVEVEVISHNEMIREAGTWIGIAVQSGFEALVGINSQSAAWDQAQRAAEVHDRLNLAWWEDRAAGADPPADPDYERAIVAEAHFSIANKQLIDDVFTGCAVDHWWCELANAAFVVIGFVGEKVATYLPPAVDQNTLLAQQLMETGVELYYAAGASEAEKETAAEYYRAGAALAWQIALFTDSDLHGWTVDRRAGHFVRMDRDPIETEGDCSVLFDGMQSGYHGPLAIYERGEQVWSMTDPGVSQLTVDFSLAEVPASLNLILRRGCGAQLVWLTTKMTAVDISVNGASIGPDQLGVLGTQSAVSGLSISEPLDIAPYLVSGENTVRLDFAGDSTAAYDLSALSIEPAVIEVTEEPDTVLAQEQTELGPGESTSWEVEVPFPTLESDFSITWEGSDVELTLLEPSGQEITPDTERADVTHTKAATSESYRVKSPLAGAWQMIARAVDVPASGEQVEAEVSGLVGLMELFPDVPITHWSYADVMTLVSEAVVAGYDDGFYHPDWSVLRDQMAVYVARSIAGGDDAVPTGPASASFPDVPQDYWAYEYIAYAVDQNVVQGYPEGDYRPAIEVTRDQMAVYIARAMCAPTGEAELADYEPPVEPTFPDVPETGYGDDGTEPFWAYKHIEYCVEQGVVNGYDDGLYHPDWVVTRDQMAVYVARAFGLTM